MTIDITANLQQIRQRIELATRRVHRAPREVTLVAVSKYQSAAAIRAAYAAGQRHFGENYAQELNEKAAQLADLPDIQWHFIGHLQRNKARFVAPYTAVIETVDSERLAQELCTQAGKLGRELNCLVQVNVGEEEQKSGCDVDQAERLVRAVESANGLILRGLMTIPPWDLEKEQTRPYFTALQALRQELGGPARLPELSMGMSHDFEVAIAEGATLVRVGTAIFGPRS